MIRTVVAVFDSASGLYGTPFNVPSIGVATRSFQDEVRRGGDDNQMSKHPGDFSLFTLGTFDDQTGRFESLPVPELVVRASSCVGSEE